jgi:formamidopyrimidine-DNA glycosylase
MPELPEVETVRGGIAPHVVGRRVVRVIVRDRRLRWPVPTSLGNELPGQTFRSVTRRAKYLLLSADRGTMILHLGMSGSVRIVPRDTPPAKHDHVDIVMDNGYCLRLRDPRRFGALLWSRADPISHRLLRNLGPEPLGADFTREYLFRVSRGRRIALRDLLLDSHIVVGVGNIYANEALFAAGLRPQRAAGRTTRAQCAAIVAAVRRTLTRAIRAGGTTLRDFQNVDGLPGYFQQTLQVYNRKGEACPRCGSRIKGLRIGQRSAFYCPDCQL